MQNWTFKLLLSILLVFPSAAMAVRVLMVSPEQTGIMQTGGLAHATTGLTEAFNAEGVRTEVLMPYYTDMKVPNLKSTNRSYVALLDYQNGEAQKMSRFELYQSENSKNPTLFLRHVDDKGVNYFDNRPDASGKRSYGPDFRIGEAFGAYAQAATQHILANNYDVVILNDWTSGLIALHLAEAKAGNMKVPKVIFAIHNLAYQGLFPKDLADFLGLEEKYFSIKGYEFWGKMSFLKAGLQFSDMIYTVSPKYAEEIATERFGAGLDGVIREKAKAHRVTGILNGITNHEWEPTHKKEGLEWVFNRDSFEGKAQGKAFLQKEFSLPVDGKTPVFILTSRMAEQKGFEYLIDAIEMASQRLQAQWIIVGDGETKYIEQLKELSNKYPDKVRYRAFSPLLEKQLTRYGDFFVNGAWFEPSGLNQLFALKNGTIPVVSEAGGLVNSVKDGLTGLHFKVIEGRDGKPYDKEATRDSAFQAFEKAVNLYKQKDRIHLMRVTGMSEDHSWPSRVRAHFLPLLDYVKAEGYKIAPVNYGNGPKAPPSCFMEFLI